MILFNPAIHEYKDGGEIIPSVTQILKVAGVIDDRWFSEESRERGSAVHDLAERYANGEREDKLGRSLESLEYVNAFARWMKEKKVYSIYTECTVHNSINGKRSAGRFDILALIGGKRVLVDLKSGGPAPWHKVQLAAYALAMFQDGTPVNPDKVANLYVKPDGTYHYRPVNGMDLVRAIRTWKECL